MSADAYITLLVVVTPMDCDYFMEKTAPVCDVDAIAKAKSRAAASILKEAGGILLESTPRGLKLDDVRRHILQVPHVIGVHGVVVDLEIVDEGVAISATVTTADRTGVEMEALTSVTVAALAVVDMIKGVDRSAEIASAKIVAKSGGRSGDWTRP